MNIFHKAIAVSTLGLMLTGGVAIAQDHDNHHYVRHDEWKKGVHIRDEDWRRGDQVDYRQYHLHAPPRGYEWREIDGNYVLANSSTGIISMTVVAR
ncbi:MAG: RcnB family protein [Terracidiphilus sp.]